MKHLFPILKDLLWIVVCGDREQCLKSIRKKTKEVVFDQKMQKLKNKKQVKISSPKYIDYVISQEPEKHD